MTARLSYWGGLDLGSGVTVQGGDSTAIVSYRVGELASTGLAGRVARGDTSVYVR